MIVIGENFFSKALAKAAPINPAEPVINTVLFCI